MPLSFLETIQLALAQHKAGNLPQAEALYRQVLQQDPRQPDALYGLGVMAMHVGKNDTALGLLQKAAQARPAAELFLDIARLLQRMQRPDEALQNSARALGLKPDYGEAHFFKGNLLLAQGHFEASAAALQQALSLQPENPDILNSQGLAFIALGKAGQAIPIFKQLIAQKPDNAVFHANLAFAHLISEQFYEGFKEYQWRWTLLALQSAFPAPLWRGEAVAGKTLLIHGEHGLEDAIQFCRYAPLAAERGAKIILRVPPSLTRLFKSLKGVVHIIASSDALPALDFHCSMMDLPAAFATRPATIPARIPYLAADKDDLAQWQKRVPTKTGIKKIGLVWAGHPHQESPELNAKDRRRSFPPELLAPLMTLPGLQFYSLQKDGGKIPDGFPIIDLMNECRDFADTAALIMQLDLVISVDTSVVHLAGALGKPVWLLNRYDSCWRWFYDRGDSPWYPTLRIFRQRQSRNWFDLIQRVGDDLKALPL